MCLNEVKNHKSQQDGNAYLCPTFSLFSINLHRAKGFVIDILCHGRGLLTNTAKERYTNNLGERKRGGGRRGETKRGGELVYHRFPSFWSLIEQKMCANLSAEKGRGGQVNKTHKDRNRERVRHICPKPIAHSTPTQFHYCLIRPTTMIKLSFYPCILQMTGTLLCFQELLHYAGLHLHCTILSAPGRASVTTILTCCVRAGLLLPW